MTNLIGDALSREIVTETMTAAEARLRAALKPFADLADTWTVQTAAQSGHALTVSNGQRMCAIMAEAFIEARAALDAAKEG